jgi:hypothetical protein
MTASTQSATMLLVTGILTREFPMVGVDLSAQFEQITERANAATAQIRAARERNQAELAAEARTARSMSAATAEQVAANRPATAGNSSSHWQELRAKWQAHVAAAQANIDKAADDVEASYAIADADLAESYAMDAIDFAASAIDEAQAAALNAMYVRNRATVLNP